MANVLPREKQLMVLRMLTEGNSLRAITRMTGVHRTTVMNLMVDFGDRCLQFMDRELRNIKTSHVEIDEQWSWVHTKQGHLSAGELRLAKLLIQKRPKAAKQRLREVVNEFPGTKAAQEAAALLK